MSPVQGRFSDTRCASAASKTILKNKEKISLVRTTRRSAVVASSDARCGAVVARWHLQSRMPIADVSEKGKTRPKLDFGRALLE
jgi:hypothetical protein